MTVISTKHCSMCQDGRKIWECDEPNCGRAVCTNCVEIPRQELSKLNNAQVKFTCPACHWKLCMGKEKPTYFVRTFSIYFHICAKMFLMFYRALHLMVCQF